MDGHAVDLRDKLARSRDKQVGLRWPIALDEFVDRLIVLAEEAGERTNRKELIAAIVATAATDGDALGTALRRYRTMTVGDCLRDIKHENNVVHLAARKPGPRPR
jgi:hypothetical protein